jgi:hypothetical protein
MLIQLCHLQNDQQQFVQFDVNLIREEEHSAEDEVTENNSSINNKIIETQSDENND